MSEVKSYTELSLIDAQGNPIPVKTGHRIDFHEGNLRVLPDIVNSAAAFLAWWQNRAAPRHDRRLKQVAIDVGLVVKSGAMLFLTEAGKQHRNAAIPPHPRRKSRA